MLSEPRAGTDDRFHAWYDEEHAPARIVLDGIHSARRLRAADDATPTWAAIYDLDLATLQTPEYRALRDRRSARERAVIADLVTFDRRVYELLDDRGTPLDHDDGLWIATSMSSTDEDELARWYAEEHVPLLHAIPGWRRTRRFRLLEGEAPMLLALHELDDAAALEDPRYGEATSTEWRARVMATVTARERRVFAHHRTFSA